MVAPTLAPATLTVPLLPLALTRLSPVPSTSVAVTFCATLGPRLTTVTVYPMVCPAVAFTALATFVTVTSANGFTGVTAVTVLFVVLLSGVVVATPAVQFCVVLEPAGTL